MPKTVLLSFSYEDIDSFVNTRTNSNVYENGTWFITESSIENTFVRKILHDLGYQCTDNEDFIWDNGDMNLQFHSDYPWKREILTSQLATNFLAFCEKYPYLDINIIRMIFKMSGFT